MDKLGSIFGLIDAGIIVNEKIRGRHTHANPGPETQDGCGKITNQFIRWGVLEPYGPGGRAGPCGTKKDNERDYLCNACIKKLRY